MNSDRAQILRGAPYFPVADVAVTADYYERVFGFAREYYAAPHFAIWPAKVELGTRSSGYAR